MSISIKSRKAKARTLQNWVASKISELLNIPWGKDKQIQGREMGQSGVDIKLLGETLSLFPYSIECKNTETWNVLDAIKQVKANQLEGTDWLVFLKKNRHEEIVIMNAEKFFELYKKVLKKKKSKPQTKEN